MRPRDPSRRRWPACRALVVAAALTAPAARAADLPSDVVGAFTRQVQPLLLNRCANGACHGGAESPAPRFQRGMGGGQPDRLRTHANLAAFLEVVGPERDARRLAAALAAGHPSRTTQPARRAAPLSGPERMTLDRWLAAVRAAEEREPFVDAAVVPAAAEIESPPPQRSNRFRDLLDAAANPPELPPPREPQGLIFKNDAPPEE